MLTKPNRDKAKNTVLTVAEGLLQLSPYTSPAAIIFNLLAPSASQKEVDQMRTEISEIFYSQDERIEKLESYLRQNLHLSPVALAIARYILQTSKNGLIYDDICRKDVEKYLPDTTDDALEEALYELQDKGFIEAQHAVGNYFAFINPTYAIFLAFDKIFCGYDTLEDSKILAQMIVDDINLCHIPLLYEKADWNKRRFNPALSYLLTLIPNEKHGGTRIQDFQVLSIIEGSDISYLLKKFLAENRK